MTHISLFSGIGGLDLAAEWAGFHTIQFVERDEFCKKLLAKRWPGVPIHDDIRTFDGDKIDALGFAVPGYNCGVSYKDSKYDDAPALYYQTKSIEQVAKAYGVTRQCMHDVLRRRGVVFYPRARLGADNVFFRGGACAIDNAQNKLEKAVLKGLVVRPSHCEKCKEPDKPFKDGRTSIQAHHYDYGKPLEVIWLCQKCHHSLHREIYLSQREVTNAEAAPRITLLTGGFP